MENEKDLLKKDLDKLETVEEIHTLVEDAELMGHFDVAKLGREKISALSQKVEEIETTPEAQEKQITEMGGSDQEVDTRTAEVDKKIEEVKAETEKKIEALENQDGFKVNDQGQKYEYEKNGTFYGGDYLEEPPQEFNLDASKLAEGQEKMKELEAEIKDLLDQISSNLPDQLSEVYNSETYKKLLDLNEKRKVEEKFLWESYDRYTKGGDGSHRRDFYLGEYGEQVEQYIDDLKFFNAPEELVKRFEEYKEKFKIPENDINESFKEDYKDKISKDNWDFESTLVSKSDEIFGKDWQGAKNFQKKFFDAYQTNLYKAKQDVMPDKKLYINTAGTIYRV